MSNNVIAKTETKEKARLEMNSLKTFEGGMKTNITSSIEMADRVSSVFGALPDYYGCKIRINNGYALPSVAHSMPQGEVYVDLYFKDNRSVSPDDESKSIRLISETDDGKPKNDLGSRLLKMSGARNGRVYKVTENTFDILEEFMPMGSRTRWNEHIQEISTNSSVYGKEDVVVCISGLKLDRIVSKIYGDKTASGRYEYCVVPSTVIPNANQEFIIQVTQLDMATVRKLERDLGIYGNSNPMFHQFDRG